MSFSCLSTGRVTESEAGCKAISLFAGGRAMIVVDKCKDYHSGEKVYICSECLTCDDVTKWRARCMVMFVRSDLG